MKRFAGYDPEVEEAMKVLYSTLKEDDRRRYAASEALKIGYGGVSYICGLVGCSHSTLEKGRAELKALQDQEPDQRVPPAGPGRTRRPGAGRPRESERASNQGLQEDFREVLAPQTAGSPTDA